MNYEEARNYLRGIYTKGKPLGLDNIRALLTELGNPQDTLPFVHIAGTNGKGSVLAFLSSILQAAGYRVGRYVSPALFSYEESIRVNEEPISQESLARLTAIIAEARKRVEQKGGPEATIFETETALSFLYFAKQHCDLVLLETGMGGASDATNIVTTTILEIFSSVSLDHKQYLGDTLAKIAAVKSGIIKPGTKVVSDYQDPSVREVLRKACEERNATFHECDPKELTDVCFGLKKQTFSYRSFKDLTIHLAGTCQIRNACLALDAALALSECGVKIPDTAIRKGLSDAVWEGRFQTIHLNPRVIIDGAHNPDAARALMDAVDRYFPGEEITYIFGVFSDKEYDTIIRITAGRAKKIYTVATKDNPRALPADTLAEAVSRVNRNVTAVGDVKRALRLALTETKKEDLILVFGSLSFLYEARDFFQEEGSQRDGESESQKTKRENV